MRSDINAKTVDTPATRSATRKSSPSVSRSRTQGYVVSRDIQFASLTCTHFTNHRTTTLRRLTTASLTVSSPSPTSARTGVAIVVKCSRLGRGTRASVPSVASLVMQTALTSSPTSAGCQWRRPTSSSATFETSTATAALEFRHSGHRPDLLPDIHSTCHRSSRRPTSSVRTWIECMSAMCHRLYRRPITRTGREARHNRSLLSLIHATVAPHTRHTLPSRSLLTRRRNLGGLR